MHLNVNVHRSLCSNFWTAGPFELKFCIEDPLYYGQVWCQFQPHSTQKMLVIRRTVLFANDPLQRNGHLQQSVLLHPFWFWSSVEQSSLQITFANEWRKPDHPNNNLQQSVLLRPLDFGHPEDRPLCKWPFVQERRNNCRKEQLSRGTLRAIVIWWYWVNIGRHWLVFGDTGWVWGSTGWYLVIQGQYNWVLFGIK